MLRQAVLFTITATTGGFGQAQVAVLDLRTGTQNVLVRGGSDARYVSSGHLVYAAAGRLHAVSFDLARLAIAGTPVTVQPEVPTGAGWAVAADGTLVYVSGAVPAVARSLVWVARQGQETPIPAAPPRNYAFPRLSPDGTRLAIYIPDQCRRRSASATARCRPMAGPTSPDATKSPCSPIPAPETVT